MQKSTKSETEIETIQVPHRTIQAKKNPTKKKSPDALVPRPHYSGKKSSEIINIVKKSKQSPPEIPVVCLRCDYNWNYSKGIPTYRIRCPACHSTRNELNRETFGKWDGVKN